ncbi:MAG: hypothetical protein Q6352_009895 [Candidatus Freyrarchaeum guaymaensis]
MWVPDERRMKKIRMDIERTRGLEVDPVRVAGWLTDFIIEVRLESLRKKYPKKKREELVEILRRTFSERDRNEL